jgi:hypothetical protein
MLKLVCEAITLVAMVHSPSVWAVKISSCGGEWYSGAVLVTVQANSHTACRAAKGLDCVFPI